MAEVLTAPEGFLFRPTVITGTWLRRTGVNDQLRWTEAWRVAGGDSETSIPPIYRASLVTRDRFGKTVTARRTVQVLDPHDRHYVVKIPDHLDAPKWSVEPGETFTALWGTGYDSGRAYVELECAGEPLQNYWTAPDRTQEKIELPVTEIMRGGLTLRVTYIRENRAYTNERTVTVPWTKKLLGIKWESFRSKLLPGQKETWTAVVTGPEAKPATAEMVATDRRPER